MPRTEIPLSFRRAAPLVSRRPIVIPRPVGEGEIPDGHCHLISSRWVAQQGGEVLPGWDLKALTWPGRGKYVHFEHHSAVLKDGKIIDPNLKPGETMFFLPDPERPYDFENKLGWNNIMVAGFPVTGWEGPIPPRTAVWLAHWGDDTFYTTQDRFARWKHVASDQDAVAHIRSTGVDTVTVGHMAFLTNARLEAV